MAVSFWLGVVVYAVAWLWGGRIERFAAALMLVICVVITLNFFLPWKIGDHYLPGRIADWVRLIVFGWLCFRSDRWWPFLMTATMGLMVVLGIVGLLDPGVSQWAIASAEIGLGYVADLTLLLGVYERWLAGEPPAARAAWARANIATAARRTRRKAGRHPDAVHAPAKACVA